MGRRNSSAGGRVARAHLRALLSLRPLSGSNVLNAKLHAFSVLTEEERRVAGLSYDGLVVRLNSVQHLLDSLGGLERMVVDRWAEWGCRELGATGSVQGRANMRQLMTASHMVRH